MFLNYRFNWFPEKKNVAIVLRLEFYFEIIFAVDA